MSAAFVLRLGTAQIFFRDALPSRTGDVSHATQYQDRQAAEQRAALMGLAWRVQVYEIEQGGAA